MKKLISSIIPLSLFFIAAIAMEPAYEAPKSTTVPAEPFIPNPTPADLELQGRVTDQLRAHIQKIMAAKEAEEKKQEEKKAREEKDELPTTPSVKEYIPVGLTIAKAAHGETAKLHLSLDSLRKKQPEPVQTALGEQRKKTFTKIFSYIEPSSPPTPSTVMPPLVVQSKVIDSGHDLEKLIKELDANFPSTQATSQDFMKVIVELEKLTREGFKKADIFTKPSTEVDQNFENLLDSINAKTDSIYTLKKQCVGETVEHPAISRLQALVNTMNDSNAKLTKANTELAYNPSFASYRVCIESLQIMLNKIKPQ